MAKIIRRTLALLAYIAIVVVPLLTFEVLQNPASESSETNTQTKNYKYCFISFDTNGGTNVERILVEKGKTIPQDIPTFKNGYHILNWTRNNRIWSFEKDLVDSDLTLKANWEINTYTIQYDFNGGETSEEYNVSYNIDSDFDLVRPTKSMNIFSGWFDQCGNRVDLIKPGMTGNLFLKARWIENIILECNDYSKGNVFLYADNPETNIVSAKANSLDYKDHTFIGWFDTNNNLLTKLTTYTFVYDDSIQTKLLAKYMNDEEETKWNISHGVFPSTVTIEGEICIKYGLYPQSLVTNNELIGVLETIDTSSYQNYYCYNNEYYSYQYATFYYDDANIFFDNGDTIQEGIKYWFKVDPIIWDVMITESTNCMLVSHYLLENISYNKSTEIKTIDEQTIYPNNYLYSPIRNYLNNDFFAKAFLKNDALITIEVDNSMSTTDMGSDLFCCDNTFDKVFLLSVNELRRSDYGFNSQYDRATKTTEYARCQNAYLNLSNEFLNCGVYWTRSPIDTNANGSASSRVTINGNINHAWTGNNYSFIKPAITIDSESIIN